MELRINEVRVNLPEFPTTRVRHRASVVWRSSWVSMEGFGQYRKISNLSSIAWKELAFTRTQQVCNPFRARAPWWCESPLVLDLNRDGFKLSPEGVGVYFDLTGDGDIKHVQWVAKGTDDGFLALDLNYNGIIDSGAELFGEGTVVIGTGEHADNGYTALLQYDLPHLGGNQDGKITKKDAIFNRLLLWVDSNADGVSHRSEVFPISAFKILRINAMPKAVAENERVDAAGNVIPYWSWVKTRSTDLPPKLKMADIFFRVIE